MRISDTSHSGGVERGIGTQHSEEKPEDAKDGSQHRLIIVRRDPFSNNTDLLEYKLQKRSTMIISPV